MDEPNPVWQIKVYREHCRQRLLQVGCSDASKDPTLADATHNPMIFGWKVLNPNRAESRMRSASAPRRSWLSFSLTHKSCNAPATVLTMTIIDVAGDNVFQVKGKSICSQPGDSFSQVQIEVVKGCSVVWQPNRSDRALCNSPGFWEILLADMWRLHQLVFGTVLIT